MMDCLTTMEKNQNIQPKEEEEQDKGKTESLYLHLLSDSPEGKISVFYKIDSSGDEAANFNQKPKLIPIKTPTNLPHIGFGSAICDSILYLFGGWMNEDCMDWTNTACYLDLAVASSNGTSSSSFVPLKHKMRTHRAFPTTVTIGKKIYIFGSQNPGYGEFPSDKQPRKWAEVFNTEDKLFKLITSPPPTLFKRHFIGVVALTEKNQILIATDNFSDLFIYDVETDQWTHTPRGDEPVSPFDLCSMISPVVGNYIFLYGSGKICAFDIDKNQFLKNNISLLEYTFFDNEKVILNGVIHHRGGWKFSVVFGDAGGYLVRFVYIVSFEIENPECCGELNVKAGTMNIVDHAVLGDTFVDSFLWSNQIVPSGNPNNGKKSLKSNLIVEDLSKLHRKVAELSRLRRKEVALDKDMFEMRLQKDLLRLEINKLKDKLPKGLREYDSYLDKLERSKRELSKTNRGECVKNENVSEIKTECVVEEISSTRKKVEAQLTEREELMWKIDCANKLVSSCLCLINSSFSGESSLF